MDLEYLVRQAQEGDRNAFLILIEPEYEPLLRYMRAHVRKAEDAEDLCHDVLVAALKNLPQLTHRLLFRRWLWRIAENKVRDYIKGLGHVSASLGDEREANLPAASDGMAVRVELWEEVDALPEELRKVVRLRYAAGLTCAKIAKLLRIGESTVRKRLFDARAAAQALARLRFLGRSAPVGAALIRNGHLACCRRANMQCDDALNLIWAWIDEGLSAEQQQQLDAHLASCYACRVDKVECENHHNELRHCERRETSTRCPKSNVMSSTSATSEAFGAPRSRNAGVLPNRRCASFCSMRVSTCVGGGAARYLGQLAYHLTRFAMATWLAAGERTCDVTKR